MVQNIGRGGNEKGGEGKGGQTSGTKSENATDSKLCPVLWLSCGCFAGPAQFPPHDLSGLLFVALCLCSVVRYGSVVWLLLNSVPLIWCGFRLVPSTLVVRLLLACIQLVCCSLRLVPVRLLLVSLPLVWRSFCLLPSVWSLVAPYFRSARLVRFPLGTFQFGGLVSSSLCSAV